MPTDPTPALIEADSLLADPSAGAAAMLLVDVRPEADYADGHLPGARCVPPGALLGGVPPATGKLPDGERLQQLADYLGLRQDLLVIAYDAEGGGWAGRLLWTLAVMGHPLLAYLNGGLPAWVAAGGELHTGIPEVAATGKADPVAINSKYIIDFNELLQKHRDVIVWDARDAKEYAGTKVKAAKGGHIPGARHLEWLELFDRQDNFKLKPNLAALLAERGIHKDKPVVTHCQTHHRSGLTWLVGRLLGYPDIKAYDGSWSEWGNRAEAPAALGETPG